MKRVIDSPGGKMKLIILQYGVGPGILWIHGGGYVLGMAAMVYHSMGKVLAKHYGGVVVSPEYRLAKKETTTRTSGTRKGITGDGAGICATCTGPLMCRPMRVLHDQRIIEVYHPATPMLRMASRSMKKRWPMFGI